MEIKGIVYYLHPEALDGFYEDMPNQYDTEKGVVLTQEIRTTRDNGVLVPYTVYIVKTTAGDIKVIEADFVTEYLTD